MQFFSKFRGCLLIILTVSFASCNGSSEDRQPSNDTTVFYPIKEYFLNQLKHIDSTSHIILVITANNGKKDSSTISKSKLTALCQPFLASDISNLSIKKYYRESVFQDQTTASYTFSYSTQNNDLPVKNVDVLLDTSTQAVKRVFITRIENRGDSSITEKLGWKTDDNFFIYKMVQLPGNKEYRSQITVAWRYNN